MLIDAKRPSLRERSVKRMKNGPILLIVLILALLFPFVAAYVFEYDLDNNYGLMTVSTVMLIIVTFIILIISLASYNRLEIHREFVKKNKIYKPPLILEKEINQYITLKLEQGRTFIYINGKRFIQCIQLILNIPKVNVPLYDEVDSIDEAAKLYESHLYQNRIIREHMGVPIRDQSYDITPEQEFWGHCSNIQAWVEHDYDTRILMSNISFPLLRELTKAGDIKARKVYKEEIALRLESGYPSVVEYLLAQGYIAEFSPAEFQTILESTEFIKNLSSNSYFLIRFLRFCISKFPTLIKAISLQIQKLLDEKKISFWSIERDTVLTPLIAHLRRPNIFNNTRHSYARNNTANNKAKAKKVYHRAVESIYKIIVIGDQGVGKTNLIANFVTKQFDSKFLPTVGVNIVKEVIELDDLDTRINLMFWIVAGQPQFYMLHRPYFNGADGMILVFDITRSSTFSNINNWYSTAVKYGLSGIPRILVANKIDLADDRKIILPMIEHLSEKLNAPYFQTSAVTGENVKKIIHKIAELVFKNKEAFNLG